MSALGQKQTCAAQNADMGIILALPRTHLGSRLRRTFCGDDSSGEKASLQGNALESIDSQRGIRADLICGTILGTTPHAMGYLKLGIMYHAHLYIARSTLIFAERTKFR